MEGSLWRIHYRPGARRLGASADWTRERFTLDDGLSRAVRVAFKRLYDDGLIYRGEYLVNWCPRCNSVISDLEVDHDERQGSLWYIRYKVADAMTTIGASATTLMHRRSRSRRRAPKRCWAIPPWRCIPTTNATQAFIGRDVLLPAIGRRIKVIADPDVERTFGTGAVKITPAHDPNDYEMGKRHDLPFINVMNKDATINENGGHYGGLDRYRGATADWSPILKRLVIWSRSSRTRFRSVPVAAAVRSWSRC